MGGVLAALAILAVLGVVGALVATNLLGGSGNPDTGQNNPQQNEQANAGGANVGSGGNENRESQGDSGVAENTPEPTTRNAGNSEERPAPPVNEPQGDGQQGQDGSLEEAAAQTVSDFYKSAADGDYERSSQLLTDAYRQRTWYSQQRFAGTFDTLQSVQFVSGPTVQVDGSTATVTFSTVARHTDRVERPDGTATLVREGNVWRIDDLAVV